MKQLELKHVAPYLPYGLYYYCLHSNKTVKVLGLEEYQENDIGERQTVRFKSYCADLDDPSLKPILRPLSDLFKEIEVNGEKFIPCEKLLLITDTFKTYNFSRIDKNSIKYVNYEVIEKLHEWHFDISDLIEQGLAIDINTLK